MVKIYKPYENEKPPRQAQHAGNRYETEYKERYDEKGNPYLEKTGEIDVYEKIQSYRDECDIQCILSRYAAGDESVLSRPGYYIDTTVLPATYTEYMNMMKEQEEHFNQLPLEIRQKFDMSFQKYMATAGEDSWLEKMGITKQTEKVEQKEVKTDEQKQ